MKSYSDEGTDVKRGLWTYDGLGGYIIAVIGLLVALGYFIIMSVTTQSANAETYYEVNQNLDGLKMISKDNHTYRKIVQ